MEINREFYSGNTRKITDSNSNMIVEFISNSLYTDITATPTKYIGKEWDKSASPWKINYKSEFFNLDYMLGYNAGYEEPVTVAQSKFFKERKKGYTFYLSSNGGNSFSGAHSRLFPVWLATLSRSDINLSDTVTNNWVNDKYKELHPVINFDYSKIFAVPFLQIKNEGNRVLFSESLRANFDPTNYSGWGVGFVYKNGVNNIDLAMEIVSLNNTFLTPDWLTTNCFSSEEFDNGLSITTYDVSSATVRNVAQLGERMQYSGNTGTYFDPNDFASTDIAGIMQYYPNRMIYINGTENPIYNNVYYGGFISNNMRPFRRTFASGVTFDDLAEYIAKEMAYIGFRFLVDCSQINQPIDSEYYYIPEINSAGVTTGNYYTADSAEAAQLPNNDWTTDVYSVTPYDGTDDDEDEDPNDYDDSNTTVLNPIPIDWSNDFQNYYVMSTVDVQRVAAYLYSELPTNQPANDFLTNNPIDCVVSLMLFPFEVSRDPDYPNPIVYFGKVKGYYPDTQIELIAKGYIRGQVQEIDCGECVYYPEYGVNDFRSYEPYCDAELILPYCGSVKLSPTAIYCKTTEQNFHKIGVKYIVDLITGACIACVYLDSLLIDTVNGQIGMTIPITGIKSADMDRDITYKQAAAKTAQNTALSSLASAVVGTVNGFISAGMSPNPINIGGAALNAVTSALSYDSAEENYKTKVYDLQHIQVPFSVRGSASPLCDFRNEQFPRLLIKRPVMLDYTPEVYAHSVGYACLKTGVIKEYGAAEGETPQYIECTGIDFSGFGGTEIEKARLKACLEGGLYL